MQVSSTAVLLVLLSCLTHALWNLLSKRSSNTPAFFLVANLFTLGLLPVFVALGGVDLLRAAPPALWIVLAVTGASQAAYFTFLALAYRHGDISVVYPLARSFPIFVVLIAGFGLGQWPSPIAWVGIVLVAAGCFALPLERLERARISLRSYANAAGLWALLAALGSSGYTVADDIGMDLVVGQEALGSPTGPVAALLYGYLEWVSTSIFLLLAVLALGGRGEVGRVWRQERGPALLVGLMTFGTYLLILWAYSLSEKVAYVAALRQLSIVVGVLLGISLLREPGGLLRVGASAVIVSGLVLVSLAD